MVHWLRDSGIGARSHVLDLGCGKGAVAVAVARSLDCRVLGIDAFDEFVGSCRELAVRFCLSDRCVFRTGLIESVARSRQRFDAVLVLNVLPYERAIPIARRLTKPGGVYVFDDAVRVVRSGDESPFPSADDVASVIERAGDRVERWRIWSGREVIRRDRAAYRLLARAARAIVKGDIRHAGVLRECLRRQRGAIAELSGPIRPACWLVRRARK